MNDAWKRYESVFNYMSDEKIEREYNDAMRDMEEAESWIEAVDSWKAAGKPRKDVNNNDE